MIQTPWSRSLTAGMCLLGALGLSAPAGQVRAQPMGLPALGTSSASELSPAVERILGAAIMDEGRHDPTYVADLDINQYLTAIGRRLAAQAPQTLSQTITVFAVRDPSINAFAMPGGYIGVNSGLVQAAQSESELAGVLAHEIGHVMQRHIARGITEQSQGRGLAIASLVGALLAGLAGQGDLAMGVATFGQAAAIDRQLGFSRSAEQEADRAGLQMLQKAGFDPRGMPAMFRRLMNASRLNEGAGSGYASTHPLSIQRLSDLENRLRTQHLSAVASSADFWFVRAHLEVLQSADDNARQTRLRQALKDPPKDASVARRAAAEYGLALLAQQAGDHAAATRHLDAAQALQDAPQIATQQVRLAAAQSPAQAVVASAAAWQRWPGSQGVAEVRARALQDAGEDAQAVAFLREVIKRWADVPVFHKRLADSLERLGRHADAHRAMAQYFELTGALPTALEHLEAARRQSTDFYEQSRLDTDIRRLRDEIQLRRELLKPYKR